MRIIILIVSLLFVFSCGKDEISVVTLEDHKAQIDLNTALSQANEERISLVEERVIVLEKGLAIEKNKLNGLIFVEIMESIFLNIRLYKMDRKIAANERKIADLKKLLNRKVNNLQAEINRIENKFNVIVNALNNKINNVNNDLQNQIDILEANAVKVITPCDDGIAYLDTPNGLFAVGYEGTSEEVTFTKMSTIPAYQECTRWSCFGYCKKWNYIEEQTIYEDTTIDIFTLEGVKLFEIDNLNCQGV